MVIQKNEMPTYDWSVILQRCLKGQRPSATWPRRLQRNDGPQGTAQQVNKPLSLRGITNVTACRRNSQQTAHCPVWTASRSRTVATRKTNLALRQRTRRDRPAAASSSCRSCRQPGRTANKHNDSIVHNEIQTRKLHGTSASHVMRGVPRLSWIATAPKRQASSARSSPLCFIHLYSPKTVEKKNNTKAIKSERKANNLTKQNKIFHTYLSNPFYFKF